MTSWHEGTLYAFDTETTGVDVFNDRIVTATVVKVENGAAVDKRTWLVDPGIEIPAGATAVHGITTEHAREQGADPSEAIPQIGDTIVKVLRSGFPLVVFNAAYDLSLLDVECNRHGDRVTDLLDPDHWHTVIDPLVLARGIDKNVTRSFKDPSTGKGWVYKLPALCERYKVQFVESHDATADAAGAALLAAAVCKKHPQIAEYGPRELHHRQQVWHRSNMSSLRAYFEREGKEHDGCDGGWPIHSDLMSEQGVLIP